MASSPIQLAFEPPLRTVLPIAGEDALFPVRRIYCVGRNYAAHVKEMGGNEREPPFFFQKPADSVVTDEATISYPAGTRDFQHEVELVLAIGRRGKNITIADAASHVFGIASGIDLTRRDLQILARNAGRPWECGKSFDQSAPVGTIYRVRTEELPTSGRISLSVNGVIRQKGDLKEMIWRADEIIAQLSELFALEAGDLIFTGTPAGVSALAPGDKVLGEVAGAGSIAVTIVA